MKRLLLLTIAPLLLVTMGCGPAAQAITGSVTYRGQPVSHAELQFEPTAGNAAETAQSFYGVAPGGEYQIDYRDYGGLIAGSYKVRITHQVQKDGSPVPGDEAGMALRNSGAAKSQTYEFDLEVKPGVASHDFALTEDNLASE